MPGLPRVVDSHRGPPAAPLAARPGRGAGQGLALYPNTASGHVTVRYTGDPLAVPATVVLTDPLGRRIYAAPLGAADTRVPVGALPPGLYHAAVWANGQVRATGRLAVVR